jgi:hypothetical protein
LQRLRVRKHVILSFLVCAGGWLPALEAAADASSAIDTTRTAFDKWVELQETVSREQRDWAVEKEFLAEEVRLLKEEIAALKEKSGRLSEATAKTEA